MLYYIFDYIEKGRQNLDDGAEFYLTTYGLDPMIQDGHSLYACKLQNSKYYDTGNKLEYIKTVIDFALDHQEMRQDILDYLRIKLN